MNKKEKVVVAVVLAIVGLLTFNVVSAYNDSMKPTDTKAMVKQVCDYTRTTEAKEAACGEIQDATHTEYLCRQNNARTDNVCWVEQK